MGFTSFVMRLWFLNVLILWLTRPDSESQSQGDSHECSVLHRFTLRERGRVAESPSVVLGCSRRDSRVGRTWRVRVCASLLPGPSGQSHGESWACCHTWRFP